MLSHTQFITLAPESGDERKQPLRKIYYRFSDTPFGGALTASTDKGLCYLAFADRCDDPLSELRHLHPMADYVDQSDEFQQNALAIVRTEDWTNLPKIPLHLRGTDFQLSVWQLLLQIPVGSLTTYGDIARKLNNPRASRAVGTAVGDNPVSFLVPCHRVIRTSGALGGYHWGLERKKLMLAREAEQVKRSDSK